ncbi:MAG: UDP-glucose--hexose-1-phosphate uridylyltransferase [Lachnospiraceae bacterium]|nr:UDP-glucose--hexose-1-phosphate uridylyltransferase [Lachnospiraceae bacterium]
MTEKISRLIDELLAYGVNAGLVDKEDETYTRNKLLELFEEQEYIEEGVSDNEAASCGTKTNERQLSEILDDMLFVLFEKKIMPEDTITYKDLYDTKIMGLLTPAPSVIRREFAAHLEKSPQEATDYYYDFSRATNYIRVDRIKKDEKWQTPTEFGDLDITINLSKPEKDPRDIAKAGQAKKSGYPSCLLCRENEGYAGHFSHPARQNHRIIPITLGGENYNLQYSPYVYYNEHCIIFNDKHIPMKIDRDTFVKLLDFVGQFPHYTAGSNADLPIVGGSILSHDHFQGGNYEFPMVRAPYEKEFTVTGYEDVHAGIINWPLSTIRLQAKDADKIVELADHILGKWRAYTDEEAFIYAETDGTPHNTITPIARMRGDLFELDLVLRNNITTDEHPMGEYHPHPQYHHIKKENIGLIEVMGLAVLPARLKGEMAHLEELILKGEDLASDESIASHVDWAKEWMKNYDDINASNIHKIVQDEIGKVFSKVLECAGVYKCTEEGRKYFERFIKEL